MIELASTTTTSSAPPSAYFARWIDHSSWSEWSPDTEWVVVDGPVQAGARGTIKPQGAPKARFEITRLVQDASYDDTTRFLGATMLFAHDATPLDGGTELTVRVTMTGPLAGLWSRILGADFGAGVVDDLHRLVHAVESDAAAKP